MWLKRRLLLAMANLFVAASVLAGCTAGEGTTTGQAPTAMTSPAFTPAVSPTPSATNVTPTIGAATPTTSPSAPTPTLPPVTQPAELFLEVLSPANESTVDEPTVEVTGRTSPDATVSVNDVLASVDSSGRFEATIQLEEGPNVIEVIASDLTGDVRSQVLAVVYSP